MINVHPIYDAEAELWMKPQLGRDRPAILFDIDGVLNYWGSAPGESRDEGRLDVECCQNLAHLALHHDANLVVHSSWVLVYHPEQIVHWLDARGVHTPSFCDGRIDNRVERIRDWVDRYEPPAWVVIDDDPICHDLGDIHFVKTDMFGGGLTDDRCDAVSRLLARQQA